VPRPTTIAGADLTTRSLRLLVVILVPAALTFGCVNGQGEFDGAGDVAGRIIYHACSTTTPPRCRLAPLPRSATKDAAVHGIGTAVDGTRDGAGFGIAGTTFGDGYVTAGHYQFRIPALERPGCAPRPAFDIKPKMFYRIVFRFLAPGRCSATVWQRPGGIGSKPRIVVSQVTG
jgi:hypothetical protein